MNLEQHANVQEDCVFCKIIQGEIPALKVYEDEFTFAFLDTKPSHPGHTLVIPKDHFENIYTTPTELYVRIQMTVQKVAIAVRNAVDADGVNIIINNEPAAGQVIFHTHTHIVPRHNDDGLKLFGHSEYKSPEEAKVIQEKVATELKN